MIDLPMLAPLLMWGLVALLFILKVFYWGYEKERKGERTGFMGRPNNHPSRRNGPNLKI